MGSQVVGIPAVDAAPTEMVGQPRSFRALDEALQAEEVFAIQRLSRAKVHGDSVLHNTVLLEDLVQDLQWPPTIHHVVFGDDFKPPDDGFALKDVVVMRDAQADSHSVIGERVEAVRGHVRVSGRKVRLTP
jgi:hypothetical protein